MVMTQRRLSKRYRLMLRWGVPCVLAATILSYVAYVGQRAEGPFRTG